MPKPPPDSYLLNLVFPARWVGWLRRLSGPQHCIVQWIGYPDTIMPRNVSSRQSVSKTRPSVAFPAGITLLLLSGCGPTPGQILFYELELSVVGFGLAWLLMWIGRRCVDTRTWFVCSYCLKPNALHGIQDGTQTVCPHCGELTSVNELPRDMVVTYATENRTGWRRRIAHLRLRPLRMCLLLALTFQLTLMALGMILQLLHHFKLFELPDYHTHRLIHEVTFPLVFSLATSDSPDPWWLFNWVLLISWHAGGYFMTGLSRTSPTISSMGYWSGSALITPMQIGLWTLFIWLGCRMRSYRWVPPVLVLVVNASVALAAYWLQW